MNLPTVDSRQPGYLILHGIENERPPEHWQHHLAASLGARGLAVRYPQLPDPYEPSLKEWREAALTELGELPAHRILVCHSLSCLLWLRIAAQAGGGPELERLLLVAPPDDDLLPAGGREFALGEADVGALRGAVHGEIRVVRGGGDPYSPGGPPRWAEALGARVDLLEGAGHITPDDGFGEWPWCLEWCLHGPAGAAA